MPNLLRTLTLSAVAVVVLVATQASAENPSARHIATKKVEAPKMSPKEVQALIERALKLHSFGGDLTQVVTIADMRRDEKVLFELVSYERNDEELFNMLFTKPKTQNGSGYLRMAQNLWFFDRMTGKWDRRTSRERLGGSSVSAADFQRNFYAQYDVTHDSTELLGQDRAVVLNLAVKPGKDLPYPRVRVWLREADLVELKREEYAASGKLMRTVFYGKHVKAVHPTQKVDVLLAGHIVAYDEVDTTRMSTVTLSGYDFRPHPANIFTKAWLESKSR